MSVPGAGALPAAAPGDGWAGGKEAAADVGVVPRPAPSPPGGSGFRPGYGELSITPGFGASTGAGPPFRFGEVLGDVFSVYFDNFVPFVLIAGAVILPLFLVLQVVSGMGGVGVRFLGNLTWLTQSLVITPLVTGAVTFGVAQELRGREASIGDCLRRALSSLGKVFFTSLLQGLAIFAGTLLCLVPGLIAVATYAVAIPAALEEKPGTGAMHRSADLTRDHRIAVFGILLTLGLIGAALGAVVGLVTASASGSPATARLLITMVLSPLTTSLSATAAAVMYYRLRSSKEGIDMAALTSVFD